MEQKLRQVTDSIHGTIYLSTLETEMISTPYFYRLHDVYQSSTVYMTYPSNRTKRYEHSIGTMELASSMLYSSVSNSEPATRAELFRQLAEQFDEVLDHAIFFSEVQTAPYFTQCKKFIITSFNQFARQDDDERRAEIKKRISSAIGNGVFKDSALDHYQYYPMGVQDESVGQSSFNLFLYRCLLQAIRLVALFHDVGHPPYSHIIELALTQLYHEVLKSQNDSKWVKSRIKQFEKILEPYMTEDSSKAYKCQMLCSSSSLTTSQLHERVGLSLFQSTINDVMVEILGEVALEQETNNRITNILYYITVVEFAISILVERNLFYKSFHKIVDGVLDADRLDYIMRDSLNSGVDWGKIPYKRIINSSRLIYLDKYGDKELLPEERPFVISYPKKISDEIVDLLLTRYKLFARINYHHSCIKSSVALQSAVLALSKNYLSNSSALNQDISGLWTALGMEIGDRKYRIIQWNDSWLISALHKTLVQLKSQAEAGINVDLLENLEEILLNKKRYYTLIKRGSDSRSFVKRILDCAGITEELLKQLQEAEYVKYYSEKNTNTSDNESVESESVVQPKDILKSPITNALDSIKRIRNIRKLMRTGDLELLDSLLPVGERSINDIFIEGLSDLKREGVIADFKTIVNYGRGKLGLPSHETPLDEVYIHDNRQCIPFSENIMLREQIETIEKNVPWIYIYYVPRKEEKDIGELSNTILDRLAAVIGQKLQIRGNEELFNSKLKN